MNDDHWTKKQHAQVARIRDLLRENLITMREALKMVEELRDPIKSKHGPEDTWYEDDIKTFG